ncbi:MAG: hypothetical protein V8Q57_00755 [Blautia sp.]
MFEILYKLINTEHCIKKQKDDSLIPGETSFIAGKVRNAITNSIRGISTTREEFIPAMTFPEGISKGDNTAETPLTSTRLKRLAPITFPRERAPWPFVREVMAVTSSGREVPSATNVRAITDSGTPSLACDNGSVVYQKICTDGNEDSPYNQEENFFDKRGIFPVFSFSCGGSLWLLAFF